MSKSKEKNKLTKKQEMFCRYYVSNGHNATKAAISAGYSEKTAKVIAMENLTKPYLKSFIEELEKPVLEELGLTENWVITKLRNFSEANILDYFEIKDGDIKLKDLTTLPKVKIEAIESIEQTEKGRIKIKLVDKRTSVVDVGKHFGMFKNVIDADINSNEKTKVYVIPAFDRNDNSKQCHSAKQY